MISEKIQGRPLVLHSNNGIQSSYSRPRVSNDNPYSEAIFRTLKYRPEFPHSEFESLEDVGEWTVEFVKWYNLDHQQSGINFVTPDQWHRGAYIKVLEHRKEVYKKARQGHPKRWSGSIKDWNQYR